MISVRTTMRLKSVCMKKYIVSLTGRSPIPFTRLSPFVIHLLVTAYESSDPFARAIRSFLMEKRCKSSWQVTKRGGLIEEEETASSASAKRSLYGLPTIFVCQIPRPVNFLPKISG